MAELPFTLDQLRILRAIVSEGSFKKAADSLYVTQPAVSLQIQNLEKQLEVSLFDRGGRKAQLTEAGHLLLSYCDRILSQCHEACRALDDLHETGRLVAERVLQLARQLRGAPEDVDAGEQGAERREPSGSGGCAVGHGDQKVTKTAGAETPRTASWMSRTMWAATSGIPATGLGGGSGMSAAR